MSTLMEYGIKRWTARRKTALVLEIIQGKLGDRFVPRLDCASLA